MSRLRAAALGAWAAMLWALAVLTCLGALLRAFRAGWPYGLFGLLMPTAGNPGKWLELGAEAAVAGALVGLVARSLRGRWLIRVLVLWAALFPAVGAGVAVVLVAEGVALHGIGEPWWGVFKIPAVMLGLGAGATLFSFALFPILGPALFAAATTIEGWVNPDESARWSAGARLGVGSLLVLGVLGCTAFLYASWMPIEGGTWLAP